MTEQQVRGWLDSAADLAGSDFQRPDIAAFRARRVARRRTVGAVAASVCVVAVVVALTLVVGGTRSRRPVAARPFRSTGFTGHVNAKALSSYRWAELPAAPIPIRSDMASVWTGTQMLVWGGKSADGTLRASGAAYTPSTNSWHQLPTAPLSARSGPLAVWTGTSFVVFGGQDSKGSQLSDGAMYTPQLNTWRTIPPSPTGRAINQQLLWTGQKAILLTLDRRFSPSIVRAAAFDPLADSWQVLPSITFAPPMHDIQPVASGTIVGHRLVVWVASVGAYAITATGQAWRPVDLAPRLAGCISTAVWTGARIVFPPNSYSRSCGGDLQNFSGTRGTELDLKTHLASRMAYSFTGDAFSDYVWTGGALLAFGNSTSHVGNRVVAAGTTAAWDPTTNSWTPIAGAPLIDSNATDPAWVWTGTELIGWGALHSRSGKASRSGLVLKP